MSAISFEAFQSTLEDVTPPPGVSPALAAMWHEAKGDWDAAHRLAQDEDDAAWVHAYLHRVEGDLSNAGYWYRRAGKPASQQPLRDEWAAIVKALLGQ
jgi:hypothetical protein